ncbi:hypothetical protein LUZ60_009348 [Juncus effusus]|nr:hypothetical protein LUZ60_009348 [Juncus effusus]
MTSTPQRTPYDGRHRQSLFLHDLSPPLPSSSAPFRRSSPLPSPPPPPILSLYDNPSPSHDSPLPFLIQTPEPLTPQISGRSRFSASPSPVKSRVRENGYGTVLSFSPGSGDKEMGRAGSPVEGLVQPLVGSGALMTLPPPREVVRPELKKEDQTVWELDEEVWVTVYGFAPSETNLVLREFEKCGEILRWVPGPKEANWMHILYQSRFDAQKALAKHGTQLNNLLIIGVKRVDPLQHRFLNESLSETPAPLPLADISADASGTAGPALIPFNLRSGTGNNNGGGREREREGLGAVASPSKSVLSRVLDVMFGI